jgi:hypothetical protein
VYLALGLFLPRVASSADKNVKFGLDVGYGAGTGEIDETAHGIAFGGFFNFNFDNRWGLGLDLNRDWYFVTETVVVDEPGGEGGTEAPDPGFDEESGATETRNTITGVTNMALSVVYAIDVMRVVPFFALGVVGQLATLDEYNIGARIGLGFDYLITENMGIGAVFHGDIFFLGNSEYQGRSAVLFRATFNFDVGEKTPNPATKKSPGSV